TEPAAVRGRVGTLGGPAAEDDAAREGAGRGGDAAGGAAEQAQAAKVAACAGGALEAPDVRAAHARRPRADAHRAGLGDAAGLRAWGAGHLPAGDGTRRLAACARGSGVARPPAT